MIYSTRPYSDMADKQAMAELAQAAPENNLHNVDLPYRLSSWALDDPHNTCLWFDRSGRLAAWAVMQTPFWTIDYTCDPQDEADLLPLILAWADQRALQLAGTEYNLPAWFILAFKEQVDRIRAFEAAGFICQANLGEQSWTKVLMRRKASLPVANYHIPPGFVVRSLAGEDEVAAYVELHQATFETKNMRAAWRLRTLHHPAYHPNLDIVVEAPDGRLGAFCIAWLNGADGHIEPLGCHRNFRHYALGRVALAEALRRLKSAGVDQIYVETDNYRDTAFRLYENMGFCVLQDVLIFRKDYETDQLS